MELKLFLVTVFLVAIQGQPDKVITLDRNNIKIDGVLINFKSYYQLDVFTEAVYDYCSYYYTCNGNISVPEDVKKIVSCCIPCDCTDDCYALGHCCRDKTEQPPLVYNGQPMTTHGEVCTAVPSLGVIGRSPVEEYLMITKCASGFKGESRDKCLNPRPQTIKDIVPVFSQTTGRHYYNVDCAKCNLDSDSLLLWKTEVSCRSPPPSFETLFEGSLESIQTYLTGHRCSINGVAPNKIGECYLNDGASCKQWTSDQICEQAMNRTNLIRDLTNAQLCQNCLFSNKQFCLESLESIPVSFQSLLDWEVSPEIKYGSPLTRTMQQKKCSDHKIYVQEENSCLHLICPPAQKTQTLDTLVCVDLLKDTQSVCYEYRISIHGDGLFENEIQNALFDFFKENNSNVMLKLLKRYDTKNANTTLYYTIMVRGKMYTNIQSSYENVLNKIREPLPSLNIYVELDMANASFDSIPINHLDFISYSDSPYFFNCNSLIAMTKLQFCPMVNLAEGEYETRGDSVVTKDDRTFKKHEYIIRTTDEPNVNVIQVCLDDYIAKGGQNMLNKSGTALLKQTYYLLMEIRFIVTFITFCLRSY